MRRFATVACLDWSGQAVARPRGIALATAPDSDAAPTLKARPGGWSREAVLDWLVAHADSAADLIVGIDFSPALPFADTGAYFPGWPDSPPDARALWSMVDTLCTDDPHLAATSIPHHSETGRHFRRYQDGVTHQGDRFEGTLGRLRVTEQACRALRLGNAVSSFNLIGASQVGKSSLTGMRLLHRLRRQVPIWPFDPIPSCGPLIVEIYTAIAARAAGLTGSRTKLGDGSALDAALAVLGSRPHTPLARYDDHATDALLGAAWLRTAASDLALWSPPRLDAELARTEGWTFGVP